MWQGGFFQSLLKSTKVKTLPLKEHYVDSAFLLHDIDEIHFQFLD